MSKDNINFLVEIIENYRKVIKKPIDIENFQLGTGYDLRKPLQVSLLWLKSKINDLQFFLISHNESIRDLEIEIYGPYDFEKDESFNEIENIFQQGALFKNFVPDFNQNHLRSSLENEIQKNKGCLYQEPSNKPMGERTFWRNNYLIRYDGNLFNCNIEKILAFFQEEKNHQTKFFKEIRGSFQDYKKREEEMQRYLGGFILPPVWFGDPPNLTQKDKLKGLELKPFIKRVYDGIISDRRIIIESDGYLGIFIGMMTNKTLVEDLYATIKDLNFIIGIFLLEGIFIKSVQAGEFGTTSYLPDIDHLSLSHPTNSKSESLFKKRFEAIKLDNFQKDRKLILLSRLSQIMTLAKSLIEEEEIYESLTILVQSRTNLHNGEINQGFILSWTIIEQNLNYMWKLLINHKKIYGKRQKNLLSGRDYTASVISEVLNLTGFLSEEDLKILNKLRKARNDFMHDLVSIKPKLADVAFNLAINMIRIRIKDYLELKKIK